MTYILPALTLIGGLLVLWGELKAREDSAGNTLAWPRRIAISGGLLVIVTAFVGAITEGNQQGRIETLAGETKDLLTGGESFAWLKILESPPGAGRFRAYLVHEGDVPAFDIDVQFVETDKCDGFEQWTLFKAVNTGSSGPRRHFVPLLTERTLKSLEVFLEPSCEYAYYAAFLQLRNKAVLQQTVMREQADQWYISTRVLDVLTGDALVEEVAPADANDHEWPDVTEMRSVLSRVQSLLGRD